MKTWFLLIVIIVTLSSCLSQKAEEMSTEKDVMYIGTYTKKEGHVNGQAEGIYTVYRDRATGDLEMGKTVAEVTNPSFVKVSADHQNLYAVSELGPGDGPAGLLYSFRINPDFSLEEVGQISTESFAPCHIAEDHSGKYIFVANYVGGVVMMYSRNEDGSLQKQQKITLENPDDSHPHSVTLSADNRHAYIADLGNDRIWLYHLDEQKGILEPQETPYIQLKEGAGPRHFTLSSDNNFAYSINELNGSVSHFRVKEKGGLEHVQDISSLPDGYTGENSSADIHLHPSGKYLYVSNRGPDNIASFEITQETGALSPLEFTSTRGKTPRNFSISSGGELLYVANQDSNNITIFSIDPESGLLSYTNRELEVKTPVCIEIVN